MTCSCNSRGIIDAFDNFEIPSQLTVPIKHVDYNFKSNFNNIRVDYNFRVGKGYSNDTYKITQIIITSQQNFQTIFLCCLQGKISGMDLNRVECIKHIGKLLLVIVIFFLLFLVKKYFKYAQNFVYYRNLNSATAELWVCGFFAGLYDLLHISFK